MVKRCRKLTLVLFIAASIMLSAIACSSSVNGIFKNPQDIVVGTWEKEVEVGAVGITLGKVTVTYTFYNDGTCVQSTDFNQTGSWAFVDESHIKITTPLNFTEVLELHKENDDWYLGEYKKKQ